MDWVHPWIGLDWIGLDWIGSHFLIFLWIGLGQEILSQQILCLSLFKTFCYEASLAKCNAMVMADSAYRLPVSISRFFVNVEKETYCFSGNRKE
jgi:hypothetical protein